MRGMIVVRAERCVGCKTCEIACAVEHSQSKDIYEAINENPAPSPRVDVSMGEGLAIPLQCRQCENAPCVEICPKSALSRADADSPVALDRELCSGCRWCVLACPYGMITFEEEARKAAKCDQCIERLDRGELPACVSACPTGALIFRTLDELGEEDREGFLVKIVGGL